MKHQVELQIPLEKIWQVFTNVNLYPQWLIFPNLEYKSGIFEKSTIITFSPKGDILKYKYKIVELDPYKRLVIHFIPTLFSPYKVEYDFAFVKIKRSLTVINMDLTFFAKKQLRLVDFADNISKLVIQTSMDQPKVSKNINIEQASQQEYINDISTTESPRSGDEILPDTDQVLNQLLLLEIEEREHTHKNKHNKRLLLEIEERENRKTQKKLYMRSNYVMLVGFALGLIIFIAPGYKEGIGIIFSTPYFFLSLYWGYLWLWPKVHKVGFLLGIIPILTIGLVYGALGGAIINYVKCRKFAMN